MTGVQTCALPILILGCTELPIAMNMFKIKGNFYDPTEILALSAIKKAKATP